MRKIVFLRAYYNRIVQVFRRSTVYHNTLLFATSKKDQSSTSLAVLCKIDWVFDCDSDLLETTYYTSKITNLCHLASLTLRIEHQFLEWASYFGKH